MSLQKLLDLSSDHETIFQRREVTEERLLENIDEIRELIAFYREYPDIFVDDMTGYSTWDEKKDGKWKGFKFRFTQRVFLRVIMRHKYVYCTFTRGFSKSFLAILALMLRAILFPGSKLSVTTGGKDQAGQITMSKVQELCKLMPFLDNELDRERGKTKEGKNNVIYNFKNGSFIDILAPRESSRGQRRTGLVIEEAILIDKDALNEIIIPTTNVDRNLPDGTTDPNEVVNQSQIYITSAGWKNSFPYAKLIEILINSILYPDDYMMMGGDYLLAIIEGAAKKDFVNKLKFSS